MVATLKDVARLAGVSVKSVSNVVNGYPYVSDELRGVLALVVPGCEMPRFAELAREVVGNAARRGYRVVIEHAARSARCDVRPVLVDGVLLAADVAGHELTDPTPLVLLGEAPAGRCDRVAIDHARAAEDATAHLLHTGRRRIAAIGDRPPASPAPPQRRTVGYRRALRRAGLAPPPGYLQPARLDRRGEGYRAARTLLAYEQRPDALLCYSDALAIGALRAVADAGLRVPQDVAVIGIGDSEEGGFARPSLSTVSADTAFIAREAVARLTTRIARRDVAPTTVVAPHRVVPRESTRPAG
ncbi:substrate-binding domain-containing protein [Micromonospora sp. DPT]|uniref:LacI family DNA-binding transcriptional regulator n=1 Tax=Micromonospora sp. DPT TaxID=3142975 RepID=UPI00320A9253